jgi:hypothetical protein
VPSERCGPGASAAPVLVVQGNDRDRIDVFDHVPVRFRTVRSVAVSTRADRFVRSYLRFSRIGS